MLYASDGDHSCSSSVVVSFIVSHDFENIDHMERSYCSPGKRSNPIITCCTGLTRLWAIALDISDDPNFAFDHSANQDSSPEIPTISGLAGGFIDLSPPAPICKVHSEGPSVFSCLSYHEQAVS
ncbi:hypothetical protein KC328_g72 [Hortaea werneckii]|nr:hypothetical protein KC328_g72 [Hortaea werneckii]